MWFTLKVRCYYGQTFIFLCAMLMTFSSQSQQVISPVVNERTSLNSVRSRYKVGFTQDKLALSKNNPQIDENCSPGHRCDASSWDSVPQSSHKHSHAFPPEDRPEEAWLHESHRHYQKAWLKGCLLQAILGHFIFTEERTSPYWGSPEPPVGLLEMKLSTSHGEGSTAH